MRVCTYPTLHGERAVVRLFGGAGQYQHLDDLGLPPDVLQPLRRLLGETSGAILVSGPAGSGKTTTVYACLREIAGDRSARLQRSLVSIEDPIEVAVDGVAQSQVHPPSGLDLAAGLRFLMRQDPEVIMVGEIRDRPTAEAALQASLTGHLLLSTFHAGSAAETVGRLLDMGIEPYVLRSGLLAILNQRLLRRLCSCAVPSDDPEARLGLAGRAGDAPAGLRSLRRHRLPGAVPAGRDARPLTRTRIWPRGHPLPLRHGHDRAAGRRGRDAQPLAAGLPRRGRRPDQPGRSPPRAGILGIGEKEYTRVAAWAANLAGGTPDLPPVAVDRNAMTLDQFIALNDEISALVRSGVPLERGLAELGGDMPGRLGEIATAVAERSARGEPLDQCIMDQTAAMPPAYRAVVQAGLRAGRLPAALEAVAGSARRLSETYRAAVIAVSYPLLVFALAWVGAALFTSLVGPAIGRGLPLDGRARPAVLRPAHLAWPGGVVLGTGRPGGRARAGGSLVVGLPPGGHARTPQRGSPVPAGPGS